MKVELVRDDLEEEVEKTVEMEEGDSVEDLLDHEGIASEEVLAAVEDKVVSKQRQLEDSDEIRVFDVIAGG